MPSYYKETRAAMNYIKGQIADSKDGLDVEQLSILTAENNQVSKKWARNYIDDLEKIGFCKIKDGKVRKLGGRRK